MHTLAHHPHTDSRASVYPYTRAHTAHCARAHSGHVCAGTRRPTQADSCAHKCVYTASHTGSTRGSDEVPACRGQVPPLPCRLPPSDPGTHSLGRGTLQSPVGVGLGLSGFSHTESLPKRVPTESQNKSQVESLQPHSSPVTSPSPPPPRDQSCHVHLCLGLSEEETRSSHEVGTRASMEASSSLVTSMALRGPFQHRTQKRYHPIRGSNGGEGRRESQGREEEGRRGVGKGKTGRGQERQMDVPGLTCSYFCLVSSQTAPSLWGQS